MEDQKLTCNNLKCRKELTEEALVTKCSHIFCPECAQVLNSKSNSREGLACTACKTRLVGEHDAVMTNLKPPEDYKTNVLSGLTPSIIMECAGRALSFWAYQTSQNISYQQYLYGILSERYNKLNARLEQVVGDANAEIDNLQSKLQSFGNEHDQLRRRNEELANALRDKSRKLMQTQELYDKAKRMAEMGNIQRAAHDAVDSSLRTGFVHQAHTISPQLGANHHPAGVTAQSGPFASRMPSRYEAPNMSTGGQQSGYFGGELNQWAGSRGEQSMPPGAHRQPVAGLSTMNPDMGPSFGGAARSPQDHPLSLRHPNAGAAPHRPQKTGFGGVGLSSGLKISQAPGQPSTNAFVRGGLR